MSFQKILVLCLLSVGLTHCSRDKDHNAPAVPTQESPAPDRTLDPTAVNFCPSGFSDQVEKTKQAMGSNDRDQILSECESLHGQTQPGTSFCQKEDGSRLDFDQVLKSCDLAKADVTPNDSMPTEIQPKNEEKAEAEVQLPEQGPLPVARPDMLEIEATRFLNEKEIVLGTPVYIPKENSAGVVGTHPGEDRFVVGFHDLDAKTKHALDYRAQDLIAAIPEGSIRLCGQKLALDGKGLVVSQNGELWRLVSFFPNGKMVVNPQVAAWGLLNLFSNDGSMVDSNPILVDSDQIKALPVSQDACGDFCPGQKIRAKTAEAGHATHVVRQLFCDGTMAIDSYQFKFTRWDETLVKSDDYVAVKK